MSWDFWVASTFHLSLGSIRATFRHIYAHSLLAAMPSISPIGVGRHQPIYRPVKFRSYVSRVTLVEFDATSGTKRILESDNALPYCLNLASYLVGTPNGHHHARRTSWSLQSGHQTRCRMQDTQVQKELQSMPMLFVISSSRWLFRKKSRLLESVAEVVCQGK